MLNEEKIEETKTLEILKRLNRIVLILKVSQLKAWALELIPLF